MRGTFRDGDYLQIAETGTENLKRGDVVVFLEQSEDNKKKDNIVHRIVSIRKDRIITRGDYNLLADKNVLDPVHLIGKVLGYERGGKYRTVANKFSGYLRSRRIRSVLLIRRGILLLTRPFYNLIKKSGIVPRIWKPLLIKIILTADSKTYTKYIHRGKTVAQINNGRVKIKKPYDLILRVINTSKNTTDPVELKK